MQVEHDDGSLAALVGLAKGTELEQIIEALNREHVRSVTVYPMGRGVRFSKRRSARPKKKAARKRAKRSRVLNRGKR